MAGEVKGHALCRQHCGIQWVGCGSRKEEASKNKKCCKCERIVTFNLGKTFEVVTQGKIRVLFAFLLYFSVWFGFLLQRPHHHPASALGSNILNLIQSVTQVVAGHNLFLFT